MPNKWWGPFAVWEGGLGVWGGILLGCLAGAFVIRRAGESVRLFADAVAPGLLVAQGIGRLGNWFNQELFGKPTNLPWGLEIDERHRPPQYVNSDHVPPDVPLRAHLRPGDGGRADPGREPVQDQAAGAVLPVRVGVLPRPHVRGAAPHRPVAPLRSASGSTSGSRSSSSRCSRRSSSGGSSSTPGEPTGGQAPPRAAPRAGDGGPQRPRPPAPLASRQCMCGSSSSTSTRSRGRSTCC